MSSKLVWSNTMTADYLAKMPEEDLRAELIDYGYDEEMLAGLDKEGLDNLVFEDDTLWEMDIDDFEKNIIPKINNQCKDGIVLLNGTVGRWKGYSEAGVAVEAEKLDSGDLWQDCDYLALYEDNGGLEFQATHHDGTHYMKLFALPEDKKQFVEFILKCMPDWIEANRDFNEYGDDASDEEMAIEAYDIIDVDDINNYCNFKAVPSVCSPVKWNGDVAQEGLEESEYTRDELIDKFGTDNLDIINAGNEEDVKLKEAKAGNPSDLEIELETLKADYSDFGIDGFHAVPFQRFAKEFPEFTNSCIKSFMKELGILTKEEANDSSAFNASMDEYWRSEDEMDRDMHQKDWECWLEGAEKMAEGRNIQWEKIWKKYYNAPKEEDESLEESKDAPEGEKLICARCGAEVETLDDNGLCDVCHDDMFEAFDF